MNQRPIITTALAEAEEAFLDLIKQIDALIDAAEFYTHRSAKVGHLKTPYLRKEVHVAIKKLGELPSQISELIYSWKRGDTRLISREGVEINMLNELELTMTTLADIMTGAGFNLYPYSGLVVSNAFTTLRRLNRVIP